MTTTIDSTVAPVSAEALAERLFEGFLSTMELLSVHLGVQLGLYRSLADDGPATAAELAVAAGIHRRYAQEWLEQQATAGILTVISGTTPDERRYELPAGHAEALLDPDSPAAVAAIAPAVVGIVGILEPLVDAYRTGGGVAYADFGSGIRHGIGGMNRPMFSNELAGWVAAVPGLVERLHRPDARALDVGCGTGWSTVALARTFVNLDVTGLDLDAASVSDARLHAAASGVDGRVRFEVGDAARVTADDLGGPFDVVCIFEALHDMGHPVDALRALRGVLSPGGYVVVADERVADDFTAPGDFNERFMYAWSVLHCLPATMAESPSHATGTVMRASTVAAYAGEAGYSACEVLDVDNPFWRFYRLVP
ncbi:MAG TPA: class I SAM-dependent methyltransferase [Acidimicrobiia bacterium]|nr:class I SAM-dependent methyltransferase [Acidimicrobiia bacterium]